MDKSVLIEYIDACEVIKETEAEINKLKKKKKTIVQDRMRGSNPDFPFEPCSFNVDGTAATNVELATLHLEEQILQRQKKDAEEVKVQVEEWMLEIPLRMLRIVRYKYFNNLSWEEVATLIGRKATGDSVKKEFQRFMKDN